MDENTDVQENRRVHDAVAGLQPAGNWNPNTSAGLERFRERLEHEGRRARRQIWLAAMAGAACLSLAAFPAPRAAAQRICETCQSFLLKRVDSASRLKPGPQRKPATEFSLKDARGEAVKLSAYRGKVVLLDFWATWCGGCKVEIPWFAEFANKYRSSGLAVIGVSMDEGGWQAVKPFIEKNHIAYPIVIGNDGLARQYGVGAMPVTVLIDRDGKIAATHAGVVDKAAFEREIEDLLRQGGGTPAA